VGQRTIRINGNTCTLFYADYKSHGQSQYLTGIIHIAE